MLTEAGLQDILRQGLWTAVTLSAPLLSVALVAGLAVGLVQALTSVQEMTLTFVPKLAAMLLVFWMTMGFMTTTLIDFFKVGILPAVVGG